VQKGIRGEDIGPVFDVVVVTVVTVEGLDVEGLEELEEEAPFKFVEGMFGAFIVVIAPVFEEIEPVLLALPKLVVVDPKPVFVEVGEVLLVKPEVEVLVPNPVDEPVPVFEVVVEGDPNPPSLPKLLLPNPESPNPKLPVFPPKFPVSLVPNPPLFVPKPPLFPPNPPKLLSVTKPLAPAAVVVVVVVVVVI